MNNFRCLAQSALGLAAILASGGAGAAVVTYASESEFLAAVEVAHVQGFESLAPRGRGTEPVVAPPFSVTPIGALIGIQDGPDSPEPGYGAFAKDGTHYLLSYTANAPPGSLRFDMALSTPVTGFGFYLTDLGEVGGTATLKIGETGDELSIATWPPLVDSRGELFFGFTQSTPFPSVTLTVTGIDEAFGIDKVYTAVPLPPALLLFGSGSVVAGGIARWLGRRPRG